MILFDFIHRNSRPVNVKRGSFYWVDDQKKGTTQIWFSPDDDSSHLILLNEDLTERVKSLVSRADAHDNELVNIKKSIENIKKEIISDDVLDGFVKKTDLTEYAKKTDIPAVPTDYLTEDDLTEYAKKTDIPTVPTDYLTVSDLDEYAKKSDIPESVELTEEQMNEIVEKVGSRTLDLTWKII